MLLTHETTIFELWMSINTMCGAALQLFLYVVKPVSQPGPSLFAYKYVIQSSHNIIIAIFTTRIHPICL